MWTPRLWIQSNSYAKEMVRCFPLYVIHFNLWENNISLIHFSHYWDMFNTRRDISYFNVPCYIAYLRFEKSENQIKRLKIYPTVGSSLHYLLGRRVGWRGVCRKGCRGWTIVSLRRSSTLSHLILSLSSCLLLSLSLLHLSLPSSLGPSTSLSTSIRSSSIASWFSLIWKAEPI